MRSCYKRSRRWKLISLSLWSSSRFRNMQSLSRNYALIRGIKIGRNFSALIKSERVYALIQPVIPKKCRDPGTFTVPCTIGKCTFADAMLDLGASINVMPSSIYKSLNVGDLEPISVIIQLENRSIVHPLGILEDVLDEPSSKGSTLILGKPFLMTAKTKIDVHV
ncbi:hypothetical protein CR513_33278, partial [Mucuna pruriens]